MVPNLQWFNFIMVWEQYAFRRSCIWNSEFWSFPQLAIGCRCSLMTLGDGSDGSHACTRWATCTWQALGFSRSVQHPITYTRSSILNYKIGLRPLGGSVERQTLGFLSDHELMGGGIEPSVGTSPQWGVCLGFSLSVSLCPSPHTRSLSLSF